MLFPYLAVRIMIYNSHVPQNRFELYVLSKQIVATESVDAGRYVMNPVTSVSSCRDKRLIN